MAKNRKLGRTTDQRLAILRNQTTDLIMYGKIETTESRAKEVKSIVDSIIALAIKEKDNFEETEVKVVKAKLDSKGNKETEKVTSKNGKEYLRVVKSRLNARRKIMSKLNKVKDSDGKNIDLPAKLFGEIAENYKDRVGGYTQIIKKGPRKGDSAEEVILKLV